MKFSALFAALSLSSVVATEVSITSDSRLGRNLMAKARKLDNDNYYSWIKDYSIKFTGCSAVPQFERDEGLRSMLMAKFKLCPSDKCGSCPNAGEYVVEMRDFVESWQEAKETINEATCQTASYNCEYKCQNGQFTYTVDDMYYQNNGGNEEEYCLYQCLVSENLAYCAQDANQDDEVNMNELAECRPMNEKNNNNDNNNNNNDNGNYQMYYVGAYCTSKGVYAGTFTDAACTKKAPAGTYEKYNYGYSLPTEPLVTRECVTCMYNYNNNNNNNNNNGNNNGAVAEYCDQLYEGAAKCEKNVKATNYKDTSGCELIHKTLPQINKALHGMVGHSAGKIFAWIFAVTIVIMAWYIYRLHKLLGRPTTIDLSGLMPRGTLA